jgi:hypothetical protein
MPDTKIGSRNLKCYHFAIPLLAAITLKYNDCMKATTKPILIRLPVDLAARLTRDAQKSCRSLNQQVIYIMRKRFKVKEQRTP